ncbi:DUF4159 domain-containing protein [Salegentibacter salarius]|uniref:DUF4159 domain-containing protein n=1 Tax=Salegentibacter salarius TaxID=435906 RepID=A0A2N0TTT9_9FLAO|nr:DUF4159 domain-containing protein [Salegentibacter salarius]OEY72447.1 hypothetical protein BHS39_13235 [Salegentibacter salarius]PKD18153.1 hypothetical protein APR40_13200 [Salegentibacter salarius]SLK03170.1 protein of unknown function [Salegentibacter salarius]
MLSFKKYIFLFLFLGSFQFLEAQEIALLKYNGGGDWYANPTSLPNLITFSNNNIGTSIKSKPVTVTPGSSDIFQYPFVHMTGHGNVIFNQEEAENLRNYLLSGGFLHIDDNYGMQQYLEKELEKIFPEKKLEELPANHPIFSTAFNFSSGLPKIHEHDNKPPQALGIFDENRLILLFTVESDLGDGWESPEVHNDPEEVRLKALKMGANILKYVFEN